MVPDIYLPVSTSTSQTEVVLATLRLYACGSGLLPVGVISGVVRSKRYWHFMGMAPAVVGAI